MADYADIYGKRVKEFTDDPTLTSSYEGQVWYNSTSGANKALVQIKAWSSGGNLGTARYNLAGAGTQTAALAFNGSAYPNPPNPRTNSTEEYSGFSWSAGGNLNTTTLGAFGFGIQTAAVAASGDNNTPTWEISTQEYNGSSWTTVNNMTTAGRRNGDAVGILTAGVAFGGNVLPSGYTNATEEYDGTNWTAGGNLTTARESFSAAGTQTAALGAGGSNGSNVSNVEQYDGSTWTAVTSLPTARGAGSGSGIQTNALIFAGSGIATSLQYDGTNWTSSATMGTARGGLASAQSGTAVAALGFGGYVPGSGSINNTEEYNSNINAITKAAWASGGNQNTPRVYSGGSGPVTSALIIGGFNGPGLGGFMDDSETYNGTSWTTITNFPYNAVGMFGLGDAEAFIGGAGYNNSASHVTTTAEWSGSSWTSGGNVNGVGQGAGGTGTQTAGIIGNRSTGSGAQAEEYDGSSWTTTPATNVAGAAGGGMAGTQTAALLYGASPSPLYDRTESWNGSSWTSVSALNTGRRFGSMGGSQTAALFGGGNVNPPTSNTAQTELYNGTSWVTSANMATARFYQRGGSHTAADSQLATSGSPNGSAISAATEEFTEGTEVVTASTLTTS